MNLLLWVLQVLAALLYLASGVMKAFFFDAATSDVASFGALPKAAWTALGLVELACVAGLIVPAALRWRPRLVGWSAATLAAESLVFVWVHLQYDESPLVVMSAALGLLMAFLAYGRLVLAPLS